MSKQAFKQAFFYVVECLINYELSSSAKTLLVKYFNDSGANNSFNKALEAINTYAPNSIPAPESMSPRLRKLLRNLELSAKAWDAE